MYIITRRDGITKPIGNSSKRIPQRFTMRTTAKQSITPMSSIIGYSMKMGTTNLNILEEKKCIASR